MNGLAAALQRTLLAIVLHDFLQDITKRNFKLRERIHKTLGQKFNRLYAAGMAEYHKNLGQLHAHLHVLILIF